jgi:hypothetical protein
MTKLRKSLTCLMQRNREERGTLIKRVIGALPVILPNLHVYIYI